MTRAELIRNYFEAMRDLVWKESLEPRFEDQHLSAAETKNLREKWNLHAEQRDWAWWQDETRGDSDADLEAMRLTCINKLGTLEKLPPQGDPCAKMREEMRAADERPTERGLNQGPASGGDEFYL